MIVLLLHQDWRIIYSALCPNESHAVRVYLGKIVSANSSYYNHKHKEPRGLTGEDPGQIFDWP